MPLLIDALTLKVVQSLEIRVCFWRKQRNIWSAKFPSPPSSRMNPASFCWHPLVNRNLSFRNENQCLHYVGSTGSPTKKIL